MRPSRLIQLQPGFPARVIHRASGDAFDMIGTGLDCTAGRESRAGCRVPRSRSDRRLVRPPRRVQP